MRIVKESIKDFQHHYEVLLLSADLAERVQAKLVRIAPNTSIHGFRPGKAPLMAVKRFYEGSVRSEEVETLISEAVKKLVTDSKARPQRDPRVAILSDTKDGITISVDFAVLPAAATALEDFSTLRLERLVPEIKDKDVDDRLAQLRKTHQGWKEAPAPYKAKKGDLIVADVSTKSSKKTLNKNKAKDLSFVIGAGRFVEDFEKHFIGTSAGDRLSFSVVPPKHTSDKRSVNATVQYSALVKQVYVTTTFDSDEDLVKDLGFDSVAACREEIKKHIDAEYRKISSDHLKQILLDTLSERHVFTVPQNMEDAEFAEIWRGVAQDNKQALEKISQKELDKLHADCRKIANKRVRLGLLLSEIGQRFKITVTQQEVDEKIAHIAMERDAQNAKKLYEYYQRDRQAVTTARAAIFEDKIVAHIVAQAKVSERKVSPKEMEEIVHKETSLKKKEKNPPKTSKAKKKEQL
ncbi:MAG: trigger factor [Holosporales bacterium]|jgi:trigger factor|nr:trigger factor [Holosporales bacterium]